MLSSNLLPLSLAVYLFSAANALPSENSQQTSSIPLHRRYVPNRTFEEWGIWAKNHRDGLTAKYGGTHLTKRFTGTNLLVNQNADASFFGSIAIGTPPVSYNVILDTGSADLWVAGSECSTGCGIVPTFNTNTSSSFVSKLMSFSVTYGSGKASGILAQDVVQLAGFKVTNQIFAVCDDLSIGLLRNPVSGLMGLGFQGIASSGAVPFWQTLVTAGLWDAPLMAFQITRFLNDSRASVLEPGGSFTMGFTDSTLFSGDIEYTSIPSGEDLYWTIPISAIVVQGTSIAISTANAAIDTGTTLIGGPAADIAAIYAQIPESQPASGNFVGYYTFPCDIDISVTIAFGGQAWSISAADMRHSELTSTQCLGSFFSIQTGGSAPDWIIGDTFLKNVYTVFRYSPASIGFAQLSAKSLAANGAEGTVPTPTGNEIIVTATGDTSIKGDLNDAGSSIRSRRTLLMCACGLAWLTW